jgi:hypothetical protein
MLLQPEKPQEKLWSWLAMIVYPYGKTDLSNDAAWQPYGIHSHEEEPQQLSLFAITTIEECILQKTLRCFGNYQQSHESLTSRTMIPKDG